MFLVRLLFFLSTDLTTYDTVKHLLLNHTSLQDNWVTHTISRSACSNIS